MKLDSFDRLDQELALTRVYLALNPDAPSDHQHRAVQAMEEFSDSLLLWRVLQLAWPITGAGSCCDGRRIACSGFRFATRRADWRLGRWFRLIVHPG